MPDDGRFREMPEQGDAESPLVRVMRELARDGEGLFFLQWLVAESGRAQGGISRGSCAAAYFEGKREIGVRLVMLAQSAGVAGKLFEEKNNV